MYAYNKKKDIKKTAIGNIYSRHLDEEPQDKLGKSGEILSSSFGEKVWTFKVY